MFSCHFLLLILLSPVIIHAYKIELSLKKEHHPLIIEWRRNKPYALPSWRDNKSMITFHAIEEGNIDFACPPQTYEEIRISNVQAGILSESLLFLNTGLDKYCEKPLVSSIVASDRECGIGEKGKLYVIGYWMIRKNNENIYEEPEFVELYDMCYSKDVIFTKHYLYPKQGLLNHKISKDELEKKGFEIAIINETELQVHGISSTKSTNKDDQILHQFVPYNDMLPIPWRISTLYDINLINITNNLKNYLDDMNDWIRRSVFDAPNSLQVLSGASPISPSSEWKWFWKVLLTNVLERDEDDEVEMKGIAIGTSDEIENCNRPCEQDEKIFKEVGLEELHENIPCLFACKIQKPLVEKFELVTRRTGYEAEYMKNAELLNLKSLLKEQKRNSRSEYTENPESHNSVSGNESNKKQKL